MDFSGRETRLGTIQVNVQAEDVQQPAGFAVLQAFPNPLNPSLTIRYQVAEPGNHHLVVYNLQGTPCATLLDDFLEAGEQLLR